MSTRDAKMICGIDPGNEYSAFVTLAGLMNTVSGHAWESNCELLQRIVHAEFDGSVIAIETLHTRGEPVSQMAMDAQLWAGRFIQAADMRGIRCIKIDERQSRFAVTGFDHANDGAVRIGLLNQFGEDTQEQCAKCIGSGQAMGARAPKKCPTCKGRKFVKVPGPLSGFNEHERSALAAAMVIVNRREERATA